MLGYYLASRRRDEWIEAGLMDELHQLALIAYERTIALQLSDFLAVEDGCITKEPLAVARKPV